MSQMRLFRLAPEVVSCHATFVGGEGWRLRIVVRRQDESFGDAYVCDYSHLSTAELLDVISAEAGTQLGLL